MHSFDQKKKKKSYWLTSKHTLLLILEALERQNENTTDNTVLHQLNAKKCEKYSLKNTYISET